MRKNSIKNVRINSEVQRALGELIRMGVKDPRVSDAIPKKPTCKEY